MSEQGDYILWLEDANRVILKIENEARQRLDQPDYETAYKELMLHKAKYLKQLPLEFADVFPPSQGVSRSAWELIRGRLEEFAQGAENSLEIGSTFYMSALLYPDDHQPGEPNNLERLIAELRRS